MTRTLLLMLAMMTAGVSLAATGDAPPRPVVVELFTSEGCSSCPPADALLRKLDTQPIPGVQSIVLEEHVDYWDDQGWKDPFSSHQITVRQSDYAEQLHVQAPYTPQMVIDGGTELLGSDAQKATQVLGSLRSKSAVSIRITSTKVENGQLRAHIETSQVPVNAELVIAVALDRAQSDVRRGENGGRHLEHVAVLQKLHAEGKVRRGQSLSKDVMLPLTQSGKSYRVVAFLQDSGPGKILGAALERVGP